MRPRLFEVFQSECSRIESDKIEDTIELTVENFYLPAPFAGILKSALYSDFTQ
jgi:hypothetical protein